jgi:hypothetical protein
MKSFSQFVRWFAVPPPSDSPGKDRDSPGKDRDSPGKDRDSPGNDPMFNELHRDLKIILLVLFWAFLICFVGLVALALLQVFAKGYAICFWALACMASGLLLGFLFGIPKVLQRNSAPDGIPTKIEVKDSGIPKSGYQLLVNTNLDDVSDWLTKIVLGVGLVELRKMPELLNQLARIIAGELNDVKLTSFVIAVILYFAIMGFMTGYFATRLFVQRAFRIADFYSNVTSGGSMTVKQETITVNATSAREVAVGSGDDKKADGQH